MKGLAGCSTENGTVRLAQQKHKQLPNCFCNVPGRLEKYLPGANPPFHLSFLEAEFSRLGMPPLTKICVLIDTLVLAKTLHPDKANNLYALFSRYGLVEVESIAPDIVHNLERLAKVYLAMVGGKIPNQ